MKLIKAIVFLNLILYAFTTATNTSTKTNSKTLTKTKTKTSTEAKTSIFSYDFLSVIKKKMKLMQDAKAAEGNKDASNNNNNAPTNTKTAGDNNAKSGETPSLKTGTVDSNTPTPAGPIYYSGWMKYFKYNDGDQHNKKPNAFFKNNQFYAQMKNFPNADLQSKSGDGQYEYIPKESYWYATLFKDSLNIANSRIVTNIFT